MYLVYIKRDLFWLLEEALKDDKARESNHAQKKVHSESSYWIGIKQMVWKDF